MADTKISGLTAVTSVAGTNEFAVNESLVSKKASASQIATYVSANITLGNSLNVNSNEIVSTAGTDIVLHSDNDLEIILGDASGVDDFNVRDSANAIVATITSDGAITALSYGGITEANLVDASATETISGAWTFTSGMIGAGLYSFTAGGTITSKDLVYIDTAGKVQSADADSTTTANVIGVAQSAGTLDNPITILIDGVSTGHSGLSAGTTYYLSATAGALTSTAPSSAGQVVVQIGRAISTTALKFNPEIIAVLA